MTCGGRRYRTEALRSGGSARVATVGQGCVVLVLACFLLSRGSMRHIQTWTAPDSRYFVLATILAGTPGCAIVGDIFKAGVWVAVIGIGILALVGFGIVSLIRGRS